VSEQSPGAAAAVSEGGEGGKEPSLALSPSAEAPTANHDHRHRCCAAASAAPEAPPLAPLLRVCDAPLLWPAAALEEDEGRI